MKAPSWLSKLNPFAGAEPRDVYIALALALAAAILYVPGIDWGLPAADAPGRTRPWAPDELGPIGPIVELRNWLGGDNLGNPQYPLFHYVVIFIFYLPYLALKMLTGGLVNPQGGFPFGFTDPASSVKHLLLIARGVSVLMAAGTVIIAYVLSKRMWNRATGVLAAIAVLLLYPMFYYGKMSRVDVPSLFWTGLVLLLFECFLREGLQTRIAAWMGVFAALAIATKDQAYAVLLIIGLTVAGLHLFDPGLRAKSQDGGRWKPLLVAAACSVVVYMFASGLAVRPEKFIRHVEFIRQGNIQGRFYFEYSATLSGYWGLLRESLQHLRDTMNTPLLLCALGGIWACVRRQRATLWFLLPIPGLFLLAFAPVRYVELRYVVFWGFILACMAARGVTYAWDSRNQLLRAAVLLLFFAGCGLSLAKGLDLTNILRNDSRYAAAAWLDRNTQAADRIEYFGPPLRMTLMPRLENPREWISAQVSKEPGQGELRGDFVLALGPDDLENHWHCPEWVHRRLLDGSIGYEVVAEFKTPARFETVHDHNLSVNPRILIFARKDRVPQIRAGQRGN